MTYGNLNNPANNDRIPRPAPQRQGADYSDDWRVGDEAQRPTVEGNPKLKRTIRSIVETFFPVLFLGGVLATIGVALFTVTNLFNQ